MKYKHALFLNPYIERNNTGAMMLFPPTGLEYVATSAEGCVEKVTLLDLRYEKELSDLSNLCDFIRKEIDIVCVGIGWDRQLTEIYDLINLIPANIPLVVGGYTATERVQELFERCPNINLVARGEGEETIKEILSGAPFENILGISYRKNGSIIHNQHRPLSDVDTLIPPDRSLRRNDYRLTLNGVNIANLSFDTVLSARGCPYNCKFCTFTLNPLGQKRNYSARSVKSVVSEIESTRAPLIMFSDENIGIDPKRLEEICDLIISRNIRKRFFAQSRIEIAKHPALLEKMVKAGFKALLIGIESPHDRILAQLNKGFDSGEVRKYFKVFKKYPIYYHGYFIYGNVTETKEEMAYIPEFAVEIGLDSITALKLRIEKFSPLKSLVESTPGYHIASNGIVYSDNCSMSDLKEMGRKIKFSFYTPSRFMKMLWKCFFVVKLFNFREIVSFLISTPSILKNVIMREVQKGRLKDTIRRTLSP